MKLFLIVAGLVLLATPAVAETPPKLGELLDQGFEIKAATLSFVFVKKDDDWRICSLHILMGFLQSDLFDGKDLPKDGKPGTSCIPVSALN